MRIQTLFQEAFSSESHRHPSGMARGALLLLVSIPVFSGPSGAADLQSRFDKPGYVFRVEVTQKIGGSRNTFAFGENGPPYWTPSPAQIAELEERLPDFLSSAEVKRDRVAARISAKINRYWRQYFGVSSSQGRKLILVNAFCDSWGKSEAELNQQVIIVDDGGECYFQVSFDPEKQTFSGFSVNGEA